MAIPPPQLVGPDGDLPRAAVELQFGKLQMEAKATAYASFPVATSNVTLAIDDMTHPHSIDAVSVSKELEVWEL